jgi:hypothetical protein
MKWFIFTNLFFISLIIKAQVPSGDLIIRNGTILTITKGTLEETDILIEKGKITAIGDNLKAPQGFREIDATGLFVMPGIIDAHSHIAIDAVNEATHPVTPEVKLVTLLIHSIWAFIEHWLEVLQPHMQCTVAPMRSVGNARR